jgi:hypothetical protein
LASLGIFLLAANALPIDIISNSRIPPVSMAMSRSRAGSAVPPLSTVRSVFVEGSSKPGFGKLAPNGIPVDFKSWLLFGVVFKNVLLIVRQSLALPDWVWSARNGNRLLSG